MTVRSAIDDRALRTFWVLVGIGVVGALAVSLVAVSIWVIDPAEGSTAEAALGLAAAFGGLTTAAVLGVAAIYAQVRNLWRFAPTWFRYLAWVVLIVVFVVGAITAGMNTGS